MATDWDLFIDEVKDGGRLLGLGALVIEAGVGEGLHFQLRSQIAKREGTSGKLGEIHWSDLKTIETEVAKAWLTHFLSGPLMFFVLVRARKNETKLQACQRLIAHLEEDARVPVELDRRSATLHLDIDDNDPEGILRDLRRSFGVLRAFKWDSKGSLLLQLADLLLGIARADRDGSLDAVGEKSSEARKRRKRLLDHARSIARERADRDKINAVILLDEQNSVEQCLLARAIGKHGAG